MAGTRAGGIKTAKISKKRYGDDFHSTIGRKGGKVSRGGGFAKVKYHESCELIPTKHKVVQCAGKKGGMKSKRGPAKNTEPVVDKLTMKQRILNFLRGKK